MNDGLDNPKPFHLRDGDSTGFADAESKVPVSWPESVESAQEELLGSLEAAGVKFPPGTWPLMLRIVSAWLEKHCDSPPDTRLAFDQRILAAKLLKPLTGSSTLKLAGQKAHVMEHALNLSGCMTARQLAKQLKLSEGRISQIKTELLKDISDVKP